MVPRCRRRVGLKSLYFELAHANQFENTGSPVNPHVVVLFTEEDGGRWLHTRGMIKFARPDLSLHGLAPANHEAALELIQRMIGFQARGGLFQDGAELKIKGAPQGLTCWHGGSMDDPDFNNVHLTIHWPESGIRSRV